MNHFPRSIVTSVLVFNDKQETLLCLKPKGVGPYPDMYLTPGGHINAGETALESAIQEVKEETGITISTTKPLLFDEFITKNYKGELTYFIALIFTAQYVSGNLTPTPNDDDHMREIRWVNRNKLKKLPSPHRSNAHSIN